MDTPTPIVAALVPEDERLAVLPDFFAVAEMVRAEATTYNYMETLSADYRGGYWHYYRLSNGGFYMAPAIDTPMRLSCAGNFYEGTMSADAAGLVATLFMLNELANSIATDKLIDLYYQVRDFAGDHAESSAIFAAID